jgi:DNA-directed RNA polymerase specialized sigma24 family protein
VARRGRLVPLFDHNALIVAIAQSADREAFAKLFDHFAPRVKGLLMKAGTPAELAEEVAQETLLTVWRKASLFARLSQVYEILDEDGPEQPDAAVSGAERDVLVRAAMTQLSPDQYRVVELAFIEGFSHQDVAKRLAIPLGTVKSRLRLALSHLRGRLEDLR